MRCCNTSSDFWYCIVPQSPFVIHLIIIIIYWTIRQTYMNWVWVRSNFMHKYLVNSNMFDNLSTRLMCFESYSIHLKKWKTFKMILSMFYLLENCTKMIKTNLKKKSLFNQKLDYLKFSIFPCIDSTSDYIST